jgi:hypothetical protein
MFLVFFHLFLSRLPGIPAAYIDPNTGGMLFQILAIFLAFFSGILFFFSRQIKSTIARMLRSARKDGQEEEQPQPEQAGQPDKPEEQ